MSPVYNFGARAYASVGLETGVSSTSPHGLIVMLYEGALLQISQARNAIATGDAAVRAKSIHKAIQIIEEGLVVALDPRGGELAGHLRSLYQYMASRLLSASIKSDVAALDEVSKLMNELLGAWRSIDPRNGAAAAPARMVALAA